MGAPSDWPEDDLFLLRELTDQMAVVVVQAEEQATLSRLSQTDALTGLGNYRFFQTMQAGEPTETADETKAVAD